MGPFFQTFCLVIKIVVYRAHGRVQREIVEQTKARDEHSSIAFVIVSTRAEAEFETRIDFLRFSLNLCVHAGRGTRAPKM